jgi:Uma2 family endonuclease
MLNDIPEPSPLTMADLLKQLGDVSPSRIRFRPPPGTATEKDVLDIQRREKRLYELVDGVLVEKVMGYPESSLTVDLIYLIKGFLRQHDLGNLAGADGVVKLMKGLIRIPDISFVSWDRLPRRQIPDKPILGLAPDLAVEVLSPGNTKREIDLKVREYFFSGVRQVWLVDGKQRCIRVYTAPDKSILLTEDQVLDGGDVLPGLQLPLREVFARVPRTSARCSGSRGKKKPPRSDG